MSTNQQLKPPASPDPAPPARTNRLDLSITKIVAGALAAMTAAALGSRLSVAGTLVGAALASIVAAVASSIYTASLAHTQAKVKTVFSGRAPGSDVPMSVEVVSEHDTRVGTAAPSQPVTASTDEHWQLPASSAAPASSARKLNWKSIVVGALAAFALAAAALTGFELITGKALSGGDGTTITQVSSGDSGPRTDTEKPKPTTSASPTPSASSSATAEPSAEPSSTPVPSSAPSASTPTTPAPVPSSTPSSDPSASAATPLPSSGAGAEN